jgi:hypothetical protein
VFFRLFVAASLLFINLQACKGGYTACVAKVKDSHAIENNILQIPLEKNTRLLYTHTKPDAKILKYDPFLSLYLIEDKNPFAYPFAINMRLQLGTAMVTNKGSCEGKIIRNQIGLNTLASYSEPLLIPSLLTSSCCWLEGIVTPRGIIQKEYLKHFVTAKKSEYGDIGIRVKNEKGRVVVTECDPFFKPNPFKVNDIILALDGKKVKAASTFMRKVLFSKTGLKHTLKIQREKSYLSYRVTTKKRYGGGELSDTFLESQGLYFDKELFLVQIGKQFKKYGIKEGDRLIQVNGVKVKNQKELREYLQSAKNYSSLLFERNGFEFFVNIK